MRVVHVLLLGALLLAGCTAAGDYDPAIRRQRLLEAYPVGQTTRADVHARWKGCSPELVLERPAGGWSMHPNKWTREHLSAVESRCGQSVAGAERYFGSDGLFSLCRCWFYFDEGDRLVDAEWEWMSD